MVYLEEPGGSGSRPAEAFVKGIVKSAHDAAEGCGIG
jgi:hypothetical protein